MAKTYKWKGKLTPNRTLAEYTTGYTNGTVYITKEAIEHAQMLDEFEKWLGRKIVIEGHSWYRTEAFNKNVGGVKNSTHLTGCATDMHIEGLNLTEEKFIKYSKKWKAICESHGCVGESGLYKWGMHLGSHITYSKTYYHWDSRSGTQINKPFEI